MSSWVDQSTFRSLAARAAKQDFPSGLLLQLCQKDVFSVELSSSIWLKGPRANFSCTLPNYNITAACSVPGPNVSATFRGPSASFTASYPDAFAIDVDVSPAFAQLNLSYETKDGWIEKLSASGVAKGVPWQLMGSGHRPFIFGLNVDRFTLKADFTSPFTFGGFCRYAPYSFGLTCTRRGASAFWRIDKQTEYLSASLSAVVPIPVALKTLAGVELRADATWELGPLHIYAAHSFVTTAERPDENTDLFMYEIALKATGAKLTAWHGPGQRTAACAVTFPSSWTSGADVSVSVAANGLSGKPASLSCGLSMKLTA
jgi:hypothetical protein